jgi:hypothetical protein
MKITASFSIAFLLSLTCFSNEILQSRLCQKDLQVRMIIIKKEKSKFITIFYKQGEELVSGRFNEEVAATKALADIEKNLVELGWNCKSVVSEYLHL